jgi:hypothetical protein
MIRSVILLEWAIFGLGIWFIVFQIVAPFIRGTPFFPILRPKRRDAIVAFTEATEEQEINAIKAATSGLSVGQNSANAKQRKGTK